jgi:hypothetical protein
VQFYDGPRCHRCDERSWNCRCPSVIQQVVEVVLAVLIVLTISLLIGTWE